MSARKGSILLLLFINVIHLILFIECGSDKVNDEYEYRAPVEKRIRRSLTTICVEIKPSHPQEEPYLMCKGGKLPVFAPQVPYTKNNIYVSNDHNIISTPEYGQDKRNYIPRQFFPYFQNLKLNENSWSGEGEKYQNTYSSNRNPYQQTTFDDFQFVNRHTQPTHLNAEFTTSRLNSDRPDQRFSTSMPSILDGVEYREHNETPAKYDKFNNAYLETEKVNNDAIAQPYGYDQTNNDYLNNFDTQYLDTKRWNLSQNRENSVDPLQHSDIKTAEPFEVKQLPLGNEAIQNSVRSRDIQYDWNRKNAGKNGLELDYLPQSLSESHREKQIFKNFNTLPFGDDPVMQQFYSSLYDTPITHPVTAEGIASQPILNEINNLNQLYSAENVHDTLHHTTIRSESIQEGQCDDFRKEAITVSEAPSNHYCKACPPEMGYTLPPIIITIPCYNPSDSLPCYRSVPSTYNSLRNENFVPENQYLNQPEPATLVRSSHNPLINIFQPKLFPHFGMLPRLDGLLGSARTILPRLQVAHGIFRGATPIPRTTQPNTLTYAPRPVFMESPQIMFPNDVGPHIGEDTVAAQLDNIQTTTLPTHTGVVGPSTSIKPTEDLQNSTEDSSILQSQSHIGNLTTIQPIAITRASITEGENQTGEESTEKMLTIIEKARRLQMRHRINSN